MFKKDEVAEYYDTTQNHYESWWGLKKHRSLHYGIWEKNIKSFGEAVTNTNRLMASLADVKASDLVLDAGCGVGGAAFYLHQTTGASVVGITLSKKQLETAKATKKELGIGKQVGFEQMDFTKTQFDSERFDVIWACESACHAPDKSVFLEECFRLLKKGGRLIICDFFASSKEQKDRKQWMKKWQTTWAIDSFASLPTFSSELNAVGFENVTLHNYTKNIQKSAKRMYYAALAGAFPSMVYNALHPNVSPFAKSHYKCGLYQYRALQQNLWSYAIFIATK